MRLLLGVLIFSLILPSCALIKRMNEVLDKPEPLSTYEKFLDLANSGDAKAQNLVGFMLYFGEVAPQDRRAAHFYFHRAADQGNGNAELNLAVMHYLGQGVPKDLKEAELYFRLAKGNNSHPMDSPAWPEPPDSLAKLAGCAAMKPRNHGSAGETTYMSFCAGCHGFNGVATYVGAPSFALAERMDKSDAELLRTIAHGHGAMPNWENKFSRQQLIGALSFVRTLPGQYQYGIAQVLRTAPSTYFLFGPMRTDPIAYDQYYLRY